jgi:putative ABC transport system substrate-binding protein
MVVSKRSGRYSLLTFFAGYWAGALIAIVGCSPTSTPPITPKAVKLARAQKIAVIRLGDPAFEEPPDSDIADGLRHAGLDSASFAIVSHDAKGDLGAVPGLIDAAARDGADLLVTLLPQTTVMAAKSGLKIPLVFQMNGEPVALGLAQSDAVHPPNLTGAYTPFHQSFIVPIARGCLPEARKLGILFDPRDPLSVIHKDALLHTEWRGVEPLTAEYHSESEVPAAVAELIGKKAEAVVLVSGIGTAAIAAIDAARQGKISVFGFKPEHARAGAIVARVPTTRWGGFEAGRRAGRILRGESAGQLPLIQGEHYVTYVNSGAAKDLGVTIFPPLMRNARVVSSE